MNTEVWIDPELRVAEAIKRLTYAEMMTFAMRISDCMSEPDFDPTDRDHVAAILDGVAQGIIEEDTPND